MCGRKTQYGGNSGEQRRFRAAYIPVKMRALALAGIFSPYSVEDWAEVADICI
jgi:hypothetical protein